jgi:hypothetical protein
MPFQLQPVTGNKKQNQILNAMLIKYTSDNVKIKWQGKSVHIALKFSVFLQLLATQMHTVHNVFSLALGISGFHRIGLYFSTGGWGTMLQTGRSRDGVPMRWIFSDLPDPSGRTMALGSTQPLTEMSTRNLKKETWGEGRPARRADNLAAIC